MLAQMKRGDFPQVTSFKMKERVWYFLEVEWNERVFRGEGALYQAVVAGFAGFPHLEHVYLRGVNVGELIDDLFESDGIPRARMAALKTLRLFTQCFVPYSMCRRFPSLEELVFDGVGGGNFKISLSHSGKVNFLPCGH